MAIGRYFSRYTAATLLRTHARARGWRHLADFPFEHLDYVVVSTQDRQTKNVVTVVDAVAQLLRHEALNLKLLMTTPIHVGATWTPLPGRIASDGLDLDVLSLPDLPRDVHAALYHGASVAVHASFYEGGQAPFPFHEAVSVGTPCLIADGPHTEGVSEHCRLARLRIRPVRSLITCHRYSRDPFRSGGRISPATSTYLRLRRCVDGEMWRLTMSVQHSVAALRPVHARLGSSPHDWFAAPPVG